MRRIDKTIVLAIKYKEWIYGLAESDSQPEYNSSKGKFYYDIIANLIWIQQGLCAYTEYYLQDYRKCGIENWNNGIFEKFSFAGELDHYNPQLKKAQGWLWDNLFLIDADVNSKKVKGHTVPLGILKPDNIDFDPHYYLEYDITNHLFLPSKERTIIDQEHILHDLKTLGLNWQPTVERREKYLNEKVNEVRYGVHTYQEAYNNIYQFFTAFELCKSYMFGK